jgi:hypothetical protein
MTVRSIVLHPGIWFFVATMAMIGGSISLWGRFQHKIVNPSDFRLSTENIRLSQPEPEWARVSIKQLLLDQLRPPSLLDANVVKRTADLLRSVGWIESIQRIEKSKAGLDIDVVYRQPVAMVKINERELLPVDRNGVIMNGDLLGNQQVAEFLRVSVYRPIAPNEQLLTWQPWPDTRVRDAAAICSALGEEWKDLQLYRVVTFQLPGERAKREPFELWTRGHVRADDVTQTPYAAKIRWGNAPGSEAAGEADALMKIQAINEFVMQYGPLVESIPNDRVLDVQTGRPILTSNLRTAQQQELYENLAR